MLTSAFTQLQSSRTKGTSSEQWQGSAAQVIIWEEVEDDLHKTMRKRDLYGSRAVYYEHFPLKAFRDFLPQEIKTQKWRHTLKVKICPASTQDKFVPRQIPPNGEPNWPPYLWWRTRRIVEFQSFPGYSRPFSTRTVITTRGPRATRTHEPHSIPAHSSMPSPRGRHLVLYIPFAGELANERKSCYFSESCTGTLYVY
jgi:hypothetical protein